MEKHEEKLVGHPSDYGSRTLNDEETEMRTADGEPRVDRGTADSAVSATENEKQRQKR